MATSAVAAGKKRPAPSNAHRQSDSKRRKTDIPTQNAPKELNIANFIKVREFEIKAIESSMAKARKGLMSRAFQQVPRHMRRRTASHNVKKVPKRLRKRAIREMKEDNTPTVSKRTRSPSRKLRLRLDNANKLKTLNQRSKTVRRRKKEAKANAQETDPEKHVSVSRVPRVKKNKLAEPPKATTKYKKRQVNKTWLPTHLWHTKRAHMTRPTEPLWRMAIPLSPTEKNYRPTHRASSARGCVAWDQSYMATVGCLGTEHTLENMLRLLGFSTSREPGTLVKKWKAGTRHIRSWIHEVDGDHRLIGPATVIWMVDKPDQPYAKHVNKVASTEGNDVEMANTLEKEGNRRSKVKLTKRLFIRIHPSSFQRFWIELLKAAKMQKPQVLVEDLRFEVGSIEITGPGSTETLLGVLKPRHAIQPESIELIWSSLGNLENVASLPASCIIAFNIVDPRLSHPPKQLEASNNPGAVDKLNDLITKWPLDNFPPPSELFSHKQRWTTGASMPTQKAINRRHSEAGKGQAISSLDKDPPIPVMLLANRSTTNSRTQGSWTVLLPWPCVDAVWRSLMYCPLRSGGTPRFGGLEQTQQLAFEQLNPWFPCDFPGTEAGKAWERSQAEKRFDEWIRRPPSRRIRWDLLDLGLNRRGELGRGWSCDWEWLYGNAEKRAEVTQNETQLSQDVLSQQAKEKKNVRGGNDRKASEQGTKPNIETEQSKRHNTSSPEPSEDEGNSSREQQLDYIQLNPSQATFTLNSANKTNLPDKPAIATIRIRLLTKGTPNAAARIYRLPAAPPPSLPPSQATPHANVDDSTEAFTTQQTPASNLSLRSEWLSLLPPTLYHKFNRSLPQTSAQELNHRHLPRKHTTHPPDPPSHIHILPPRAPQQVIDEFGPPPPPTPTQIDQQQRESLMAELMKFDFGPQDKWDVTKGLVPCPDEEDLIGFVTTGGFNLREGKGTAIGGIWVQRVVEGWRAEQQEMDGVNTSKEGILASQARKIEKEKKRREKERCLCVVRNAGESIGRLGVWEVCE